MKAGCLIGWTFHRNAKRAGLNTTEALKIEELKKLRSEAESAESQSTATRAQARAEKQAAELNCHVASELSHQFGSR